MPDLHDASLRAEWHRYYSPKRSAHQHMQLELLGRIPARRVLEIGPYLGYVTALLDNAGYAVETLDFGPRAFARPDVPHHDVDLTTLAPGTLTGFDAILCCETLEHIPWETAQATLRTLAATGSRFLIVSVPWSGADLTLSLHVTPHWLRAKLALKWPKSWRRFTPSSGLMEHHWEVGYRGTSLAAWERALAAAGWRIRERVFTTPTRSVMHLCANTTLTRATEQDGSSVP